MTDNTDKHGPARTGTDGKAVASGQLPVAGGLEPDYEAMGAAMQGLGLCPHCAGELDMYPADLPAGYHYSVCCDDCGMESPLLETPQEAAAWWLRLGQALAQPAPAPAFGGDAAPVQVGLEVGVAKVLLKILYGRLFDEKDTEQEQELLQLGIDAIRGAIPAPRIRPYDATEKKEELMSRDLGKDFFKADRQGGEG